MVGIKHDRPDPGRHLKYLMILALFAALGYFINRGFILPQEHTPVFFHRYFSDILALPIYLPLSFYLAIRLKVIPQESRLEFYHIFAAVIIFSIIFEGLVPVFDQSSTRDLMDILAYAGGGILVLAVSQFAKGRKSNLPKDRRIKR